MDMSRVAIVAALERELRPLIKDWHVCETEVDGQRFRFFEKGDIVVVCGGIGAEAARRAAEAVIAAYTPQLLFSAGFAGALDPKLKVGNIVCPRHVIDSRDGSSASFDQGVGILVSFGSIATPAQKKKLRDSFGAQAVDMEAAAVARAAEARGTGFAVVKVISDELDFEFPSLEHFIDSSGQFRGGRFAWFTALRPWLWPKVAQLAKNSKHASLVLCDWLGNMISATSVSSDVPTVEALHHK
jgi:adenosylhomocysteine nucleosidase